MKAVLPVERPPARGMHTVRASAPSISWGRAGLVHTALRSARLKGAPPPVGTADPKRVLGSFCPHEQV